MMSRSRRAAIVVGLVGPFALIGTGGAQATSAPTLARSQTVVTLQSVHGVYAGPKSSDKLIEAVGATRPITAEPTTLPVLGHARDSHGHLWLKVRLPGRTIGVTPPPETGWIVATNATEEASPWHIVVNLAKRQVQVYEHGKVVRTFPAVVGKPSTPTPTGEYFVEEVIQMPSYTPGAPFALATSDRSKVLQEFEGGPGQIALHGLDNVGGDLGTAESHGCIRLADADVTWLSQHIAPGVPISIH